ncbi:TonB-dependent receptor [Bacteroides sp. 214]|uniref:TonB-dependent receptor domain-containing protein n=1 Tax=Bacteroides sp. 214 TaxID=2302935 RepID=UPI0013D14D7D|nr:TonB-dependent receptor [Bacteroides sp. 214]NDW12474.1 TonB-dependent receptor [Bacteroides sp. 214]
MIRTIALILTLIVSTLTFAQTSSPVAYTVKGVLLDSLTNEGEPYATIRFALKTAPGKAVKMAVTDMNGKFEETINQSGDFVMTITSVGRVAIAKEFKLTPETKTVDLGTMYINDDAKELAGVEVVAQKPLVKVDIDKIEYNIEDDPDSKTNSVIEMLRKVPLVTVDGEDNIQVNGSSSFKVQVNGKENTMMSNNPKEIFQSMPANSIKSIEVITNPGAKYDAEGVGGILNIITVSGAGIEGYTLTMSARATNAGAGGGLFGTVKSGKLTVSGNYGISYSDNPKSYSYSTRETAGESDRLFNNGSGKNDMTFQHGNLEASYELDTLRLISLSFGLYGGDSNSKNYSGTDFQNTYSYNAKSRGDNSWYSIRGNIDYQRLFKLKGRMLTFSYRINTQPRTNDSYTNYLNFEDKDETHDWEEILDLQDRRSDQDMSTTEHTFQADYVTPIGKLHTIETGTKYIIRNNISDTKVYLDGSNTWDYNRSSHYKHLSDILAAYLGYTLRYQKFSLKTGVRYEYTNQNVKYIDTPGENYGVDYNNLVPSATVAYKLGQTQNLSFGYNMRIWRPSIFFLNPYRDTSNPTSIFQGNPDLDTEKSHAFNLTFSSFTAKFSANLSLRHSFNNNSIEQVASLIDNNVLYSTYENIGKSRNTNMNFYLNWNATPKTRLSINGSGGYSDMRAPGATVGGSDIKNSGWQFYSYGSVQHTFPLKIRASLNAGGSTKQIMLQGSGYSYSFYALSLNRSFLKGERLTVSLFAQNFLDKYNKYKHQTIGTNYSQWSSSKQVQRRFGINISYRLGELKAQVKKAARSISNDDVKEGGGSAGAGGE